MYTQGNTTSESCTIITFQYGLLWHCADFNAHAMCSVQEKHMSTTIQKETITTSVSVSTY